MLQALARRSSPSSSPKGQQHQPPETAPPLLKKEMPPEEYRAAGSSRTAALRAILKDRYRTLQRPRGDNTPGEQQQLDATSTLEFDDDDSCLYSDNEEDEQAFRQHQTWLKRQMSFDAKSVQSSNASSSVRSSGSKRSIASSFSSVWSNSCSSSRRRNKSRRKHHKKSSKKQQQQPPNKRKLGYDALVEESAPPVCSVVEIMGSAGAGADHYGGVTNLDDILDAFARQRDPERPKILIPTTTAAATANIQVVEEDALSAISTTSSVVSRARRKIANVFKKKKGKNSSKKNKTHEGDHDCSTSTKVDDLDSLLARYRGQSSTPAADNSYKQQPPEQRSAVTSHRSLGSRRSVHSAKARLDIFIHPSRSSSSEDEKDDLADIPAEGRGYYDCDTGSVAAGENLADYKVLKPSQQRKSSLSKASSPIREHSPRVVTKRRPVIDPLDIDRLLNKSDSEEEVILFERTNDDTSSTISSLTSDSSLTLSSGSPTSVMDEYYQSNARASNGKKKNLLDPAFGKHYSGMPASRRLFKDAPPPPPPPPQNDRAITAPRVEAPSAYNIPSTIQVKSHCSISILLIEPKRKIFEIVSVDIARGTPIGTVLEKACQKADDVHIRRQTYVGLCNTTEATMDMKLPVLKFLPSLNDSSSRQKKKKERFLSEDEQMKREMERRLLVAVPNKATARECIKIRGLLWKNPKLQTWWHNSAPLCRLGLA